jgi:protein transport protein SEC31
MANNQDVYNMGLIAGGMVDGVINVWDPAKIAAGEDDATLLACVEQHQGAVTGLHFNPHKESSHLLASGGSDTEIYVMSLERPDDPSVFIPAPPPNNTKHTADITQVAWNTQVPHILASSAQNGSCCVWDLRQKRAW